MLRLPGPICAETLGRDWINSGTLARTRSWAPGERTPALLTALARRPHLSSVEQELIHALETAGISDRSEQAMFLAQMAHETQGFTKLREDLRYSAQRLLDVFPKRFKDRDDADRTVKGGTDAIAERIYGGRADLGNAEEGDGARYIGRGYVQLTGRANYAAAGAALGIDLVSKPALAEQSECAARIAVWFWKRDSRLGVRARAGDVPGVTRIINGALIGLADRQRRFEHYSFVLRTKRAAARRLKP